MRKDVKIVLSLFTLFVWMLVINASYKLLNMNSDFGVITGAVIAGVNCLFCARLLLYIKHKKAKEPKSEENPVNESTASTSGSNAGMRMDNGGSRVRGN